MKPKATAINQRSRALKGKIVKKEPPSEEVINIPGVAAYNISSTPKASVEIVNCISYQKFRYSGENRPGKKYQEKEFMTLKLSHLQDKVVRVVIICTDADNRELIHPNGLVGKDCHDGIYDKEYAVTKQFHLIKIPYLRTERMKTKKNEHRNILGVLSSRASHLPSPYRERCLSQCTDKYTSSREKFDTTKVCLGVIVTVESHQGILNGSLHAISHVVRNASEKTSLSILKLSNDSVPALTGACVDIFTTEDGPAIEPDKYLVYVSFDSTVHGMENWQSEKHLPGKENLLYKRVITYQVPPFEPNPNLDSPVEVTLHLECPQSNQFCNIKFNYIPQREMMMFDDQCFLTGLKRGNVENDVKPSPKKLRSELYDNDGSTESIKANLKTKIKARNETPNSIVAVCMENQGDAAGDEDAHYITEHKQHNMYIDDCRQLIHRQDPQTGESTYLLNMDACKSNSNSETATFVGDSQYVIQFQEKAPANHLQERKSGKSSGSIMKTSPQDFKVVATGYSDTVPANTVLVYTTNGILPERVDDGTLEHMFIQTVSDGQLMVSPSYRHGEKHVNIYTTDGVPAASIHKGSSGRIIRGNTISENRSGAYAGELIEPDGQLDDSQASSDSSIPAADNRLVSARMSHNTITSSSISSITSSFNDRYGSIPTSFSSSIPPIRRMLIPSKTLSNSSPWVVDDEDDSASDYNSVVKTFETSNKRSIPLKSKSIEEDHYRQRTDLYVSPSSQSSISTYFPIVHIPEKQLQHMGVNEYSQENGIRDNICMVSSSEACSSDRDESGTSHPAGLSSIDVAEAIANNLPTMKIFEIAEHLEDSMTTNAESEDGTQNT